MSNTVYYKDYFSIDENYFPCVNESAIKAGLKWNEFYPHQTFIELLKKTERILSRHEKRSLWISGAYGTGKSYAAFALSKLLTVSSNEVNAYFNKYDALAPHKTDLMQRLIAAKKEGRILTCYRYASSAINSTNDLIIVIQELIAKGVEREGYEYKGSNTLKNSILKWLKDSRNKTLFAGYVNKEYKDLFGGWSVDEIIEKLNKPGDLSGLVGKINNMAGEIGITALKIDMDSLIAYIKDIISGNKLKAIVFVLDEFSEFFHNNRSRLTDFQKLVEICAETPFYLLVVAHQMGSYFHDKDLDAKKIKDRFLPCEITMPDNIAFDLMKDALKIKPEAEEDWTAKLDDLQDFTKKSRRAVSEYTGIKEDILKGVLPLHPMSALLLKHISDAFKSNQRSMFDFIKNDGDYKDFQWFIAHYGPLDGAEAFLTVDMLWEFFCETGKDNLASRIRDILDVCKRAVNQHKLVSEEEKVLKTILIMQAVSTGLNDEVELFIANEQNLYLCFEGTDYEHKAQSIADKLVRSEVIYKKPLGGVRFCYSAAAMVSDTAELDKKKKGIINGLTARDLRTDEMTKVFNLTASLKMRCNVHYLTFDDNITRFINDDEVNKAGLCGFFNVAIGIAKDDSETVPFSKLMQDKIINVPENKNIVLIDTMYTPFGSAAIEEYAEYMAQSDIYRGKDNSYADDMLRKAKTVISAWGNRICNGQIIIYSKSSPQGIRCENWHGALNELCRLIKLKYPYAFEYTHALSEVTLQIGSKQQWVEAGLIEKSTGQTVSAEKIVNKARKDDKYWISDPYSPLGILKNALDKKIQDELKEHSKISIKDILLFLCSEYGFMPSNLYSFIAGFLLKEYANETYSVSDGVNNEKMSVNKMKEIVDEGFKELDNNNPRYRDKFIRIMSEDEQAFCRLISGVFDISENQCGSVEGSIKSARIKAKQFKLPFWVLKENAKGIEADFISEFIRLLNPEQEINISAVSGSIGKLFERDKNIIGKLKNLIKTENFDSAMISYLKIFEDAKLLELAEKIRVNNDKVLGDIKRRFYDDAGEGLWLWNKETGEEQIHKVIREYEFIIKSNALLDKENQSIDGALLAWQEKLKFIKISYETAKEKPKYLPFIPILYSVAKGINGDIIKEFYNALNKHEDAIVEFLRSDKEAFAKACAFQLKGLSESEISDIYKKIPLNCFTMSKENYMQNIDQIVADYKSNAAKTQLRSLWKEKTKTDTPYQWSDYYKTPLLACVEVNKWNDFKRAFDAVELKNSEDGEVKFALEFFAKNPIWDDITNKEKIDNAFIETILGSYKAVLTDINDVRKYLSEHTQISPYDWSGHSEINRLVKELALSKYNKEPLTRVMRRIDSMDDKKLKEYLKRLVKGNITVGIEILEDGE